MNHKSKIIVGLIPIYPILYPELYSLIIFVKIKSKKRKGFTMDIKKELQQVEIDNNDSVLQIRNAMEAERDDLEKKIHIFKAIEIVNVIDEMVRTNLKELYLESIYGIVISHSNDEDSNRQRFYFNGIGKHGERLGNPVSRFREGLPPLKNPHYLKLQELFSPYEGFGYAPKSCNYGDDKTEIFYFSENIKDKVLGFLLGDELKSIFDYNHMDLSLSSVNKVNAKSPKI